MFELLAKYRLQADVYLIEAFTLPKNQSDFVAIHTNLPDGLRGTGLVMHVFLPRGTADSWASLNFPGVDFKRYTRTHSDRSARPMAAIEHKPLEVLEQYDPARGSDLPDFTESAAQAV